MKFNIGDKVTTNKNFFLSHFKPGQTLEVTEILGNCCKITNGDISENYHELYLELVPIINNLQGDSMSTWNPIPENLEDVINDNQKAFIKLGWMDTQLTLTQDGKNALMNLLLKANEKELGEKAIAKIAKADSKE